MGTARTERRVRPFVAGERTAGEGAKTVRDSTTGEPFATVAAADGATLERAVAAAEAAVERTREASVRQRAAWCEAVADGVRERADGLADALVREAGVPVASARAEVRTAAAQFDAAADLLRSLTGKYRTWTTAERALDNSLVTAAPLGVVRCHPGARAPLATAAVRVAPALAAGNATVVTPPLSTPVSGSLLIDIVAEHVPSDAVAFVPLAAGGNAPSDGFDAVLDAESGADDAPGVSRFRERQGGRRTTLVFPDADLDAAAGAITDGGPAAVGRRLAGASHVLVHESVRAALVERLDERAGEWHAGDLFDEATTVAPLGDDQRAERLAASLDDALTKGATLVRGGGVDGRAVEPTVLADVPADAALLDAPEYGPVVPVTTFEDEDHARTLAAELGPASAARVFTDRHSLAMGIADAVDAERIHVHGTADGPVTGADRDRSEGTRERVSKGDIVRLTRTKRVVHR